MKYAVSALIFDQGTGRILGVSRKDNHSDFGLPGGKVDEGENFIQALVREVKEETGLSVLEYEMVFAGETHGFYCPTYLVKVTGEVNTIEKGLVKLVTWYELMEGTFGEYNTKLREIFRNELFKPIYSEIFKPVLLLP